MADYRTIKMSFWTDPYVEGLSAEGKLLYLYLFTCPLVNNLGVMETTVKRISYETDINTATLVSLLENMERDGKILRDNNFIWVTSFIKNQCTTSPLLVKSMKSALQELPSKKIRHALCLRYPHIFECQNEAEQEQDTLSIPYQYPMDTVGIPSGEFKTGILNINTCQTAGGVDGEKEENLPEQGELVPIDRHNALNCPQQKILDAYHEILPELPRVVKLDDDLQKNVRTRWQEKRKEKGFTSEEDGVAYFRTLFEYVARNKWLMGRADGSNGWTCNYRWLMQRKNFAKVTSGNYAGWQE